MTLAVLELNDQSLLIQAEGGPLHAQPGFARVTASGIECGEDARASAWREPQHSYNQYWCHLNQTPLVASQQWARHHADIAFAQLKSLWDSAGSPETLLILVPGSFSDTQLSLLLGLVSALPAKAHAVIDSALAACLQLEQDILFIDMQLHQTVLTLCRPEEKAVSIIDQEVFPDLGMIQIQNSVARYISKLLIDSDRYDPLHASGNEQTIFDQIPDWLTRLRWEKELSATLHSEQKELPFILRQDEIKNLIGERLVNIRAFVARHPGCLPVLSHASGLLAGLSNEFSTAEVTGQTAGIDNSLAHYRLMSDTDESVYRVRSLVRSDPGTRVAVAVGRLATHVLYGDQALPLAKPVSIRICEKDLQLVNEIDKQAALTVVLRNRQLEAVHRAPGMDASLPQNCVPGEAIIVDGHQLRLIEVQDG